MKKCVKCLIEKPRSLFFRDQAMPDGYRRDCKDCHYQVVKESVCRRKTRLKQKPISEKKCGHCGVVLPVSAFSRNGASSDGVTQYCKKCGIKTVRERKHLPTWWYRRCFGKGKAITTSAVTPAEVRDLFQSDPFCFYCRRDMRDAQQYDVHVDHKVPRSKGGLDCVSNLAISCEDCNRMKHDRTDAEFRAFLKEYVARFQKVECKVISLAECAKMEKKA